MSYGGQCAVVACGVGGEWSSSELGKHPSSRVIKQYLLADEVPIGGISLWRVTLPILYVGACREPRHPDAALITGGRAYEPRHGDRLLA